jgi:hypothetical protein
MPMALRCVRLRRPVGGTNDVDSQKLAAGSLVAERLSRGSARSGLGPRPQRSPPRGSSWSWSQIGCAATITWAAYVGNLSPAWAHPAPTNPVRYGRASAPADRTARPKARCLLTPQASGGCGRSQPGRPPP